MKIHKLRLSRSLSVIRTRLTLQRNRHLLDNLQAKAFQSGNVHRRIREQANALDAQVRRIWPPRPMARKIRPVRACEPSRARSSWCRTSRRRSPRALALRRRSAGLKGIAVREWSISKPREVLCR